MGKSPPALSIMLSALVMGIAVLGATGTLQAQPPAGSIDIGFDERLKIADFLEIREGDNWQDVIPNARHATGPTETGVRLHSVTAAARISREVHLFEGEAAVVWRLESATDNRTSWRLGLRIPAGALRNADCRMCLFYARADQTTEFPLRDPESLPAPLNTENAASINMTVKSIVLAGNERSLRVDVDRDGGAWQLYWQGDELRLSYRSDLYPDHPIAVAARLRYWRGMAPEGEDPQPLQVNDWLSHPFSVTPSMSKRGFYHPGEPIALHLHGLSVSSEPEPLPVEYAVTDYYGKEVARGEATLLQTQVREDQAQVHLQPGKLGMFRIRIAAENKAMEKELTFGVVPKPQRRGDDRTSVFGTHAILSNPHYPTLAAQMGMRWTRMWGGNISSAALWSLVEPEQGTFRWNDPHIQLARSQDLNILGLLGGRVPPWVEPNPRQWDEDDLAAWRRYVYETVSHYRDEIRFWEVWNEPYGGFKFDAEAYTRVLKAAYEAAKEADPDCQVVGTCGPPWSAEWFEKVFELGGLEYQDIVSAHLYPPGGGTGCLDYDETFRSFVAEIRAVMRKHGGEKELWDTEAGMGPASPFNRLIEPHYFRRYGAPVPVDVMTDMAARLYVVHLVENVKFFYYLLHGSFEYDSALCENDGSPLPAAAAIAVCSSMLDGAEFIKAVSKGPVRAYAFRRDDQAIIALWGVGLAGRRPMFRVGIGPQAAFDVMGNPAELPRQAGAFRVPVSPSPLYLAFAPADLDGAISALEQAPEPELDRLAFDVKGSHDSLTGPAIAVDVTSFESEPTRFEFAFPLLPAGWQLAEKAPFGRVGEYVVHGKRRLYFPVAVAEGAQPSGEVEALAQVNGRETPLRQRVELPVEPILQPTAPHQPDAPLVHRDIQFVSAGPWTAKTDTSGLLELYRGEAPLLTGFYYYVARRGLNAALLSFRDCTREVEALPDGQRIILPKETPENGRCRLTIDLKETECLLRWELSVPPTEEGWGELGFYVPGTQLNDGYPCELEVTTQAGATRAATLSSESYPMKQYTGFKALGFRSARAHWGMDFSGFRFPGSHGWHFQDFRDSKGRRDHYRVVLGFSATEGYEADMTVRVWADPGG